MKDVNTMKDWALRIRKTIIQGAHDAGNQGVHIGGALSIADILAVLYGAVMRYDVKNPTDEHRDRLILSKGHDTLGLYAALTEAGFITHEELKENYLQDGGFLPTHPVKYLEKGIECSSGSLGMGLGFGIGEALAFKMKGLDNKVYVIMGDGECDEGSGWEAFMAAKQYKLNNLVLYIDKNGLQSDGLVADIMPINLAGALKALGWNVFEVDGHDVEALYEATQQALAGTDTPSVIVATTVKGKGVSFMENNNAWHHGHLSQELYEQAITELDNGI
jgi:transketolase